MTNQAPILPVVVKLGETERLGEIAWSPACGEPLTAFAFPPQDLFAPLGLLEIGQAPALRLGVALLHLLVALGEIEEVRMAFA